MTERQTRKSERRSQSIEGHSTTQRYFNLVKVNTLKTFKNHSFGTIDKIFEVEILQQG